MMEREFRKYRFSSEFVAYLDAGESKGLVAALLSFLPPLFGANSEAGAPAWRWLSGVAGGYWVPSSFHAARQLGRSVDIWNRWVVATSAVCCAS